MFCVIPSLYPSTSAPQPPPNWRPTSSWVISSSAVCSRNQLTSRSNCCWRCNGPDLSLRGCKSYWPHLLHCTHSLWKEQAEKSWESCFTAAHWACCMENKKQCKPTPATTIETYQVVNENQTQIISYHIISLYDTSVLDLWAEYEMRYKFKKKKD